MEIFSTNISLLLTEIYELVKEFAALHIFYVKYWLCICQCIIYCFNWKKMQYEIYLIEQQYYNLINYHLMMGECSCI